MYLPHIRVAPRETASSPMTRPSLQPDHSRDQCVSASLHSAPLQLCFRAGQTSRWGKVWCSPWPSLPRRFRSAPLRCASSHTSRSEWKLRLPVMSVCGPASPFYPAEAVPHTATPAEHDRAESARTPVRTRNGFCVADTSSSRAILLRWRHENESSHPEPGKTALGHLLFGPRICSGTW